MIHPRDHRAALVLGARVLALVRQVAAARGETEGEDEPARAHPPTLPRLTDRTITQRELSEPERGWPITQPELSTPEEAAPIEQRGVGEPREGTWITQRES